jgi:hypothetical protein
VVGNKLNPVLSTIIQEFQNKNYYGQQIYDPNDPGLKQLQDGLTHAFGGIYGPIALSALPGAKTGREQDWWDFAWAVLGFPPAGKAAYRTGIENRIVDTAYRMEGKVPTELSHKRGIAYDALRVALKERNPAAVRTAEKALADTGVKPPQIKGFETHLRKNPDETYEAHLWKGLPSSKDPGDTHLKLLRMMNSDERKKYFALLSLGGQLDILKLVRQNHEELQIYWQLANPKLKAAYAKSVPVR